MLEVHNCIGITCLNIYVYHLKKKLQCCDLEILSSVLPWGIQIFLFYKMLCIFCGSIISYDLESWLNLLNIPNKFVFYENCRHSLCYIYIALLVGLMILSCWIMLRPCSSSAAFCKVPLCTLSNSSNYSSTVKNTGQKSLCGCLSDSR